MKCPITEEKLFKIAEDLDMVADLGIYHESEERWEMWKLEAIVRKLDDMRLIKREIAEVYFSRTYGWGFETLDTHVCKHDMRSRKEAFEKARAMGFEPVDQEED